MSCEQCGHENPEGNRFCGGCGAALALDCAQCQHENPPGNRFCGGCGAALGAVAASGAVRPPTAERSPRDYTPKHLAEKILRSKSALEGERKRVTVLFADIQHSMQMAEQLDPEEWHRILDRFLTLLSEGVHRFEGTVNQYTGDGIMALFGAPIAHEDHAQRACFAALQLLGDLETAAREVKREFGLQLSVRIGVHSGEVVVGKIGDDLRMDYTAQGHSVGLAQRMESLASPGTAYLSEATAELVSGYFSLEDLGDFNVKGASEPVRVFELMGVGSMKTRFDRSRAAGLTRFVGRVDDMQALEAALEQARAGNPQVLGIVADAGTGKSRLCFEFAERCRAEGIEVYEGHAVAHGKNIPYLPMLELFRSFYGIEEGDSERVQRDRIAGRMLLLDDSYREVLPLVFDFMGVPDPSQPAPQLDPETRQRHIHSVIQRVVQGDGNTLSVNLIEDLHWLDPGSETLLEQLVESAQRSRALTLVNFRPEFHADWMQKTYYRQLPLAPLGPDAIQELLSDLLGSDHSTAGLAKTIHARTGGNPFFTEEVVQTLIESGHLEGERGAYRLTTPIERLEIPDTVQSILAARIDRLGEREKQVLQAAAVIGKEFPEKILAQVAELPEPELRGALSALMAAEFVYEQSLYPVVEYAFKHPLTQEVALDSQLHERRRALHAAVARALEATDPDRGEERAPLLAHHWDEAGEVRPAVAWHQRAAEWIGAKHPTECVRHWERIRALARGVEGDRELDELRLLACRRVMGMSTWRLGYSEQEIDERCEEAIELAERLDNPVSAAVIISGLSTSQAMRGEAAKSIQTARRAEAILETANAGFTWEVITASAYNHAAAGCFDEALERLAVIEEATKGDPRAGLEALNYSALGWVAGITGITLSRMGRLAEARERLAGAEEIAREAGSDETRVWAIGWPLQCMMYTGELETGVGEDYRRRASEAIDLAEEVGSRYTSLVAREWLAFALLKAGELEAAERELLALVEAQREARIALEVHGEVWHGIWLARRLRGDAAGAVLAARESLAFADGGGSSWFSAFSRTDLALALVDADAPAREIRETIEGARDFVRRCGGNSQLPRLIEAEAKLAGREGNGAALRAGLEAAEQAYRAIGADAHADRVASERTANQEEAR
jgi:class 3 adenylate cyclase